MLKIWMRELKGRKVYCMSQLIVFFLACSAWCSMTESLAGLQFQCVEPPYKWRILDKDLGIVKKFHGGFGGCSLHEGFTVTIDQDFLQSDYIEILKKERAVSCNLWHYGVEKTGAIIDVDAWKREGLDDDFTLTLYQMIYDSDRGCVIIKNCRDGSESKLFDLQSAQRAGYFSEYNVTEDNSLSMTRFFRGDEATLRFVKVLVDYNDFNAAVVSWGEKSIDKNKGAYFDDTQGLRTLPLLFSPSIA